MFGKRIDFYSTIQLFCRFNWFEIDLAIYRWNCCEILSKIPFLRKFKTISQWVVSHYPLTGSIKRFTTYQAMANSRFEYVRNFESANDLKLLPNCYVVVRVDGQRFHQFSSSHKFHKPNDKRLVSDKISLKSAWVIEAQFLIQLDSLTNVSLINSFNEGLLI